MTNTVYCNKVVYGDTTLIDLTADTVTVEDVLAGVAFHLPNGAPAVGTGTGGGGGGSGIYQDSNGYIVLPTEECEGIFLQDQNGYIIIPSDKWGPIPSNYGLITWNGAVLTVS